MYQFSAVANFLMKGFSWSRFRRMCPACTLEYTGAAGPHEKRGCSETSVGRAPYEPAVSPPRVARIVLLRDEFATSKRAGVTSAPDTKIPIPAGLSPKILDF